VFALMMGASCQSRSKMLATPFPWPAEGHERCVEDLAGVVVAVSAVGCAVVLVLVVVLPDVPTGSLRRQCNCDQV